MLHRALLINGQWYDGIGPRFSKTNPATNELLWESNEAHASDVDRAVAAAPQRHPRPEPGAGPGSRIHQIRQHQRRAADRTGNDIVDQPQQRAYQHDKTQADTLQAKQRQCGDARCNQRQGIRRLFYKDNAQANIEQHNGPSQPQRARIH